MERLQMMQTMQKRKELDSYAAGRTIYAGTHIRHLKLGMLLQVQHMPELKGKFVRKLDDVTH
jgi:hypothetical protein